MAVTNNVIETYPLPLKSSKDTVFSGGKDAKLYILQKLCTYTYRYIFMMLTCMSREINLSRMNILV